MRSRAFKVVDEFEAALCEYTGAPYAVTVDSCTNALFLSLRWRVSERGETKSALFDSFWREVEIPRRTYVGVPQAIRNAGFRIKWRDEAWRGDYVLRPHGIIDSAKRFERDMYVGGLTCLSFQAGKKLPIGRGGAILSDNKEASQWLRNARLDGRTAGADYSDNTYQFEGWHMYMTPPDAARGLWLMTYIEDDDPCDHTGYPDVSRSKWN